MTQNTIPSITGWKAFKKSSMIRTNAIEFFSSLFEEYGDFLRFNILGLNVYLLRDPILIRYVLQENSNNYHKSIFYKEIERLIGKGLLTSEGQAWKKNRKLVQTAFKKSAVANFTKIFYEESEMMLKEWENKTSVDISKEMMRITFNIVGRALFSANLEDDVHVMDQSMGIALVEITKRIQSTIKTPFFLPTKSNRRLKKALKDLDGIVNRIISKRISSGERINDLLDTLIYARDEETGQGLNKIQIRDEVMTFLTAGHETTSNALTWTMYLLSEHSDSRARVIQEIKENIPFDKEIDINDLDKLEFTSRVLKESMRLYPPAWVIERNSIGDDTIGNTKIKAKDVVSICTYAVHRNPAYWKNPEQFDPDRFLPENENKRHNFAYIPFGGGPRVCVGNNFAFTEAMTILASIYRKTDAILTEDQIVEKEPLITLRPKYGMKMNLKKVNA